MARRRKPLSESKIAALMMRGGTAESIAAELGESRATIGRRMRELKGKVQADRASKTATKSKAPPPAELPPLPDSPEDVPEGAEPKTYDYWLTTAEANAKTAQEMGDLDGFGKMGRLAASLLEAKRKATPLPKEDPNEAPDMVALGAQVAARLHHLIDRVVDPTGGARR